MAKHIGIVACSAEGAALCYRTICSEAPEKMGDHGHPEITMHTYPLSEYMVHVRRKDWEKVSELMVSSAQKVAGAGADFAISPDNTIHQAFRSVQENSPIPWLHIAESVAKEARKNGFNRLAILGTKYLMMGPVYPETMKSFNITCQIPDAADREKIDDIIFTQLVYGRFLEKSKIYINEVIQKMKDKECDAAVLGCTEIPLLVEPDECPLPTLDSTRLLAREALRYAIEEA